MNLLEIQDTSLRTTHTSYFLYMHDIVYCLLYTSSTGTVRVANSAIAKTHSQSNKELNSNA